MTANSITIGRVLFAFLTIGLYQLNFYFGVAAFFLTIVVIYLDALDGVVARKLNLASDFGALLDITGDRIVENVYWIYFSAVGMISFWVPMIVIARSFMVDTVRSVAFAEGKTPFGEKTMMKSGWTKALTASRWSRAVYGVSKVVVFCLLGGLLVLHKGVARGLFFFPHDLDWLLRTLTQILVATVVVMCVVRGVPVLWDGRDYLLSKRYPRILKDDD